MSPRIIVSLCILAFATGCESTEPTLTIKVDSKPRGVEVYMKYKTRGRLGIPMLVPDWDSIGTTPFSVEWPLGSVGGDPYDPVEYPIVLEARPSQNATGLYKKRAVCDYITTNSDGNAMCVIFFDLTTPQR